MKCQHSIDDSHISQTPRLINPSHGENLPSSTVWLDFSSVAMSYSLSYPTQHTAEPPSFTTRAATTPRPVARANAAAVSKSPRRPTPRSRS